MWYKFAPISLSYDFYKKKKKVGIGCKVFDSA